jgi:dihydrofolate reductase
MAKVLLEMSMSLDGYTAGPDVSPEEPMGRGGDRLHEWMFEGRSPEESERYEIEHFRDIGAVIVGRRMADLGIVHWGEEPTFHAPVFVVTSRPADTIVKAGGTSYVFVTGGIDEALDRAREAAEQADVIDRRRRGRRASVPAGGRGRRAPAASDPRDPGRWWPAVRRRTVAEHLSPTDRGHGHTAGDPPHLRGRPVKRNGHC